MIENVNGISAIGSAISNEPIAKKPRKSPAPRPGLTVKQVDENLLEFARLLADDDMRLIRLQADGSILIVNSHRAPGWDSVRRKR